MKKSLSKSFMIEEGFAEMEAEKTSISVKDWYLEDCVASILNEIGDWFYELEPYDQALLLVEAANCLAKNENPAWYWAKDMLVDVLLNGKTSTDLPPDDGVWRKRAGACQLSSYTQE